MTATRIEDLENVGVEHLLGAASREPLVKLRAESASTVLLGQLSPAQARQIAEHLTESAARAEYEHDLWMSCEAHGYPAEVTSTMLVLVREGEQRRHERGDG